MSRAPERKRGAFTALLASLFGFSLSLVFAAEQSTSESDARTQLAATQAAIAAVDVWLSKANARQNAEEKGLQSATEKLAATARKAALLDTRIDSIEAEIAALTRTQRERRSALDSREAELGTVLRALYKQGDNNLARALLSGESPDSASRRLHYLRSISSAQRETIAAFQHALAELERSNRALSAQRQAQSTAQETLQAIRAALDAERAARQVALQKLAGRVTQQQGEREQLEMDAAGISQLIDQIETSLRRIPASAQGTRFGNQKGALSAPLDAPVARGFRDSQQGITFATAGGENVSAVHGGRVVFADWLRGTGLLVIVDHGEGYMSLYGGNESLAVQAGDSVVAGALLATAGAPDTARRGLYFEIRKDGIALDPKDWLD